MARFHRLAVSLALVLLALVCLTSHVSAQCGYGNVDLSSLTGKDWPGTDGKPTFNYNSHVCGPVSNVGACTLNGVPGAACQIVAGQGGATYVTGLWQNPVWSATNNGVQYTLQGANTCRPNGFAQKYTATFIFNCASTQDAQFNVVPGTCAQTWTMNTPAACTAPPPSPVPGGGGGGGGGDGGDGGKKKLSGGWIFIIILCVVIPVYVAAGCVYKRQRLGASGIDMCPNIEFWRELPRLVKDGCIFTWTKLRALCNRGGAGAQSYESM